MPLILGHPPILGHPGLWPVLRNFSGAAAGAWAWIRILVEEGVVSCKKMYSCVRIRAWAKKKATGSSPPNFDEASWPTQSSSHRVAATAVTRWARRVV